MKFTVKRVFAVLMSIILVINISGIKTFAEGEEGSEGVETVTEEISDPALVEEYTVEEIPEYIPEEIVSESEFVPDEVVTTEEQVSDSVEETVVPEENATEVGEPIQFEEVVETEKFGDDTTEEKSEEVKEVILEEETVENNTFEEEKEEETKEVEKEEVRSVTTYQGAGSGVSVTAVLSDPTAIPDDAQLVVSEISGGSFDSYLAALNSGSGLKSSIVNTWIYDVSFVGKDKSGKSVEYEPERGSVTVTFNFLNDQLEDIGIKNAADLLVAHLPEVNGNILYEGLSANTNVASGVVTVTASTFSAFAFTSRISLEEADDNETSLTCSFPGYVTIPVKKDYNGNWSGKEFEFTLEHISGNDWPCSYTAPQTIKATEWNKNPSFAQMSFGPYNDWNAHEYIFKISEKKGNYSMDYDTSEYYVKVVAQNGWGEWTNVSYTVYKNQNPQYVRCEVYGEEIIFTNRDKAEGAKLSIPVQKDYNGNWSGKEFEFKLEHIAGNDQPSSYTAPQTIKANEWNKNPSFAEMSFGPYNDWNQHVYTFKITETEGTGNINYDKSEYYVQVTAQTSWGNTSVSYNIYKDVNPLMARCEPTDDKIVFTNTDKPEGAKLIIPVQKDYNGDWNNKEFEFVLEHINGNDQPASFTAPQTIKATAANKNPSFAEMSFGPYNDWYQHVYLFKVTETEGSDNIVYDKSEYYVQVTAQTIWGNTTVSYGIYKGVNPQLAKCEPTDDKIVFVNKDIPKSDPAEIEIPTTKKYDGDWKGKEFEFKLSLLSDNDQPTSLNVPQTIKATEGNKNPKFTGLSFGPYADNNTHTYVFLVEEIAGTSASIVYDDTKYYVQVEAQTVNYKTTATYTVFENENPLLTRCWPPEEEIKIEFTNTDRPEGGKISIPVQKDYDGDWKNKEFEFVLEHVAGEDQPAYYTVPQTIKATEANKNPSFAEMSFGPYNDWNQHVYTFKITETEGSDNITYDKSVYYVQVTAQTIWGNTNVSYTVYKDVNPVMAKCEPTDEKVVFTNKDKPKGAEIEIPVTKNYDGDWKDKEFVFTLDLVSGDNDFNFKVPMSVVANNANKNPKFSGLSFGPYNDFNQHSYVFKITENVGSELIDYDTTEYYVQVTAQTVWGNTTVSYTVYKNENPALTKCWPPEDEIKVEFNNKDKEEEFVDIDGTKTWVDEDDKDGLRPVSITIHLYANGVEIDSKTVTKDDGWKWSWTDLPKYENKQLIKYTISEDVVQDYETEVDGYDVINTHKPETVNVEGVKTWNDDGKTDLRPVSITIHLYKNGVEIDSKSVTKDDGWKWSWTGLPKYDKGKLNVYTISEEVVKGYVTEVQGYDVINTPTVIHVSKVDVTNQKELPGAKIQIIDENGKVVEEWISGDKPHDIYGLEIGKTYTLHEEVAPDGFTIAADTTFVINEDGTVTSTGTVTTDGILLVEDMPTSVKVSKVDITNQKELPGATIQIIDENGKVVVEWVSTDTPMEIVGLKTGVTYTLHEEVAPDGFMVAADTTFTIDEYGNVTSTGTITSDGSLLIEDKPTSVKVSKVDVTDQKELPGATIQIIDENGKVVAEWVSTDTPHEVTGLIVGKTYTLHEEVAPHGYKVASDTTFVINPDGSVTSTGTVTEEGILLIEDEFLPISIDGTKTWEDKDDQDGKRPVSITIHLYADGKEIASVVVTKEDGWKWHFGNLPEYKNGKKINYTITEDVVTDYTSEVDGYDVINTYTPEVVQVSGAKSWEDMDDQDGLRPKKIVVHLFANGKEIDSKTVTEDDGWKWNWTGLPKNEKGKEIKYTISEDVVEWYETEIDGYNIKNTHVTEKTKVEGTKTWEDDDDASGKRPISITIHLYKNGVEIDSKVVTKADGWKWSWIDLPKYEKGKEIKYTISEDVVKDYVTEVKGYDVINTYKPEKTTVDGIKTWEDKDDQDGLRPKTITINLFANGKKIDSKTVTENDGWKWSWSDLDKYDSNHNLIKYTITEEVVEYYKTDIDGYNVKNTHVPETTKVEGTKTWKDYDDAEGKRPISITIHLYKNGVEIDSKTVTKADGWKWSWIDLPKYEKGKEIKYTISEDIVEGYVTEYDKYDVINTYNPDKTQVDGIKTWEDKDDQDGLRPKSIVINLFANGKKIDSKTVTENDGWKWSFTDLDKYDAAGKVIKYTITEDVVEYYKTDIDGYNVKNTHVPETTKVEGSKTWKDYDDAEGKRPISITIHLYKNGVEIDSKTVTKADGWKWSWTDLPKYEKGKEIKYTISEDVVTDYVTEVSGYDVINTYNPDKTQVDGIKTWEDMDDQDGLRPKSIVINLYANGKKVDSKTVTEDDGWKWSFKDLDKYDAAGKVIKYTITEEVVEYYKTDIDGYNVKNTHVPETTKVEGSKTWKDYDDAEGKRPISITIHLYKNGVEIDSKTVTKADGWKWSWTGLPKYEKGKEVKYTISEDVVEGYDTEVTGYDVINTYKPEKTKVEGIKTWEDMDDQDGLRPKSIVINLFANGKKVDSKTVTEDDGWKWSFTDLDKYDGNHNLIKYTITEEVVEYYKTEIDGYNVKNTHVPETTKVEGTKTWEDHDDADKKRPVSITIHLYKNGKEIDTKSVTAKDGWYWSWNNLPKYEKGKEIKYTISEDIIEGYTPKYEGYDIINTYTPDKIRIDGSKTWVDEDNKDGLRPAAITINLFANGKKVDSKTVTKDDGWKWSFTDLDKYDANDKLIDYTISEEVVEYYETEINGYDVKNTHVVEYVKVEGSKTWEDDDDVDGKRPAAITINLLKNGKKMDSKTVTKNDGWKWSWTNLPKYEKGQLITYSITEDVVEWYETEIDGYNVKNTHVTEVTSVEGTKTWVDDDDAAGKRPVSITINLFKNGTQIDSKTVTKADGWSWKWENLPKYEKGKEIKYTVTEDVVVDYETEVKGYDVINTYKPEKVTISGAKTWKDFDDQDGKRPVSITINLFANGTKIDSKTVTAKDGWKWSFTDLDKFDKDHKLINYTISEDVVKDYETEVKGYDVINTHKPELTKIEGTKTWKDNDDQDGKRPVAIIINLLKNGTKMDSKTVTADDGWKWSWTNLEKYEKGKLINYTISEEVVEGYETEVKGYDVINTHKPEVVSINGTKTWNDSDNQDGKRPVSITITLFADGTKIDSKTVTANEGWKWSWTNLPKYNKGKVISYTISEDVVTDYTTEIKGYDVINTHKPEVISINGTKTWDDSDDKSGKRPVSITVNLFADGTKIDSKTVTKADGWKWSFTNLPKYNKGKEIKYTTTEEVVKGYITKQDGYDFINKITSVKVSKVDVTNQKELPGATIQIKDENGKVVEEWVSTDTPHEITGLEVGKTYTLHEVVAPLGYDIATDTTFIINPDGSVTTTGSKTDDGILLVEDALIPITINGTKTWNDKDDQDGKRPVSITIHLYADNTEVAKVTVTAKDGWKWSFTNLPEYKNGKKIEYTISEDVVKDYTTEIKGYDVVNTYSPDVVQVSGAKSWEDADNQDGKRPAEIRINLLADGKIIKFMKVTAKSGWKWNFTGLPKFKDGKEIKYTITEDVVEWYETEINGYNVKNTHVPETTEISGKKTWVDEDNKDGLRPESITVNLWKKVGSAEAVKVDSKKVTKDDNWSWKWTELPKYEKGVEITYSVTEDVVKNYSTEVKGYDIVNTHTKETVDVLVKKIWDDKNNFYDLRPASITVHLFANDKEIAKTEIKPDENGDWSCAWYALPKYENGKLITYKVTEDTVYEYSTEINNEYDVEHNQVNVTITNKYIKPSDDDTYITISGTKTWDDKDNQDGLRPASITVKLSATVDGKEVEILDKDKKAVETKVTVKADAKGNWSYSWKDLLKFKNGKEIKYSVTEEEVKYYTTTYEGYNIKNTHVPETVSVEGSKTWDDSNNSAGKRPTSITIRLLADGKEVKYTTVTEKSGWKWSFTGLPKYANGKVITYTIKEDTVTGYTTTIKGYNVTNTYKPETVNISGQKVWNDSNDKDKIRPKSIEVYLLADGKVIQTITVTSTNSWKFTFSNLPKYSNGKAITYTIAEKPITGYTGVISGYTITNTHTPTTPNTPVTPPNTGDDSDVNGLMGILMTSLAGMVAVVLSRKKEETEA